MRSSPRASRSPPRCWKPAKPTSSTRPGISRSSAPIAGCRCSRSQPTPPTLKKRGEIAEDLDTKTTTETPLTFPNGVHIAEVEIDPDTGHMTIAAYTAVDDCGTRARPHDRRGPAPRRGGGGARPGADGEHRLRQRQRPARHRLVHGLRHAARRGHAAAARRHASTCRRPPIRSASRASARPAPRRRSRRS